MKKSALPILVYSSLIPIGLWAGYRLLRSRKIQQPIQQPIAPFDYLSNYLDRKAVYYGATTRLNRLALELQEQIRVLNREKLCPISNLMGRLDSTIKSLNSSNYDTSFIIIQRVLGGVLVRDIIEDPNVKVEIENKLNSAQNMVASFSSAPQPPSNINLWVLEGVISDIKSILEQYANSFLIDSGFRVPVLAAIAEQAQNTSNTSFSLRSSIIGLIENIGTLNQEQKASLHSELVAELGSIEGLVTLIVEDIQRSIAALDGFKTRLRSLGDINSSSLEQLETQFDNEGFSFTYCNGITISFADEPLKAMAVVRAFLPIQKLYFEAKELARVGAKNEAQNVLNQIISAIDNPHHGPKAKYQALASSLQQHITILGQDHGNTYAMLWTALNDLKVATEVEV